MKEIYRRELPPLDDDFAKDQGDCQSLAELRERVREDLLARARAEADARARQGLLDIILERNQIEVPESLVAREQRAMESDLAANLRSRRHARRAGGGAGQGERGGVQDQSGEAGHRRLVLDALVEQEKIEATDDELAERIGAIMRQGGSRGRDRLSEFYSHEENREALRQSLRREKVLDQLMTRAADANETEATPPA